jgi:hypothetical protein
MSLQEQLLLDLDSIHTETQTWPHADAYVMCFRVATYSEAHLCCSRDGRGGREESREESSSTCPSALWSVETAPRRLPQRSVGTGLRVL